MLTKEQGVAMLVFALLIMIVLFGALYFSRSDESVCLEHRSASSSKSVTDGKETVNVVEDHERRCQ